MFLDDIELGNKVEDGGKNIEIKRADPFKGPGGRRILKIKGAVLI